MDFATDPLWRPLDLPLPLGALSPCCAWGAVQSIVLVPSEVRNPDKSIWMLLLPFDDDESSNAGPSEQQPLALSAMATLVQVASVWRYKYLFRLFFSKTNLNLWYCSTDWNFEVVEIDSGWRIILEQDRKNKIVLFCF